MGVDERDYIFQVPQSEAVGSELNIILIAPGFQFDGDNAINLPLDTELSGEISPEQVTQTARFHLTALRPEDCKSGGYKLEESKAGVERLTNLVLLIAIAYTCAGLQGQLIKSCRQQKYIGRLKELNRMTRRHSNFWVGFAVSSAFD